MRIVRFRDAQGAVRWGEPLGSHSARPLKGSLFDGLELEGDALDIEELLAPVDPPNTFAIGRNYLAHAQEQGAEVPELPLVFSKTSTSINAPGAPIRIPRSAPESVDYEGELAVVIGREAKDVDCDEALSFVLGYTCANDVTARDCQRSEKQWTRAKGFDTFCPLGPWIVTADALDPNDLSIRTRVNGELRQDSRTSCMMRPCAQLISYLSQQFTLLPGTVILTGTPAGIGAARTPPLFLSSGDTVEVEIEGIGTLVNPVR